MLGHPAITTQPVAAVLFLLFSTQMFIEAKAYIQAIRCLSFCLPYLFGAFLFLFPQQTLGKIINKI